MSTSEESGEPDGDRFLVAEYVLGLLDAAEHERMAARIAADPALRRELRFWRLRRKASRFEISTLGLKRISTGLARWRG